MGFWESELEAGSSMNDRKAEVARYCNRSKCGTGMERNPNPDPVSCAMLLDSQHSLIGVYWNTTVAPRHRHHPPTVYQTLPL